MILILKILTIICLMFACYATYTMFQDWIFRTSCTPTIPMKFLTLFSLLANIFLIYAVTLLLSIK